MSIVEIRNGVIKEARIYVEDHGVLTSSIDIDFGGMFQSFGGYNFGGFSSKNVQPDRLGQWIRGVFRVTGKEDWSKLTGSPIRVEINDSSIARIGHFLKDEWFDPTNELVAYEKIWSDMQKSG